MVVLGSDSIVNTVLKVNQQNSEMDLKKKNMQNVHNFETNLARKVLVAQGLKIFKFATIPQQPRLS